MQLGKELPFSIHNTPANGVTVMCSPLAFSSLFDNKYFIDFFEERDYQGLGLITNQENEALRNFSLGNWSKILPDSLVEQYAIFETDAKFTLPVHLMPEILSDKPDADKVYIYLTNTFSKENLLHKQIVLWGKYNGYLIDTNNKNVIVMEHQEYIASSYIKRLTNLSVLMSIPERKFVGGTDGFDIKLFNHLI